MFVIGKKEKYYIFFNKKYAKLWYGPRMEYYMVN